MVCALITFSLLLSTTNIATGLIKSDHIYINKCCPFGHYINENKTCEKQHKTLTFANVDVYSNDIYKTGKFVDNVFTLKQGKFHDEDFKKSSIDLEILKINKYVIENGELKLELPNVFDRWILVPNEDFCIDYYIVQPISLRFWAILPQEEGEMSPEEITEYSTVAVRAPRRRNLLIWSLVVWTLFSKPVDYYLFILLNGWMRAAQDWGGWRSFGEAYVQQETAIGCHDDTFKCCFVSMLVSCFFMLLVLIVYFLLPELQNLGGKTLMAYVASLFLAFLMLAIIQLQRHTIPACIGLTMGIYYFFLASFCWMSIMSLNIWWTFRGYAKARSIHRRGESFKFLMYCLYAWGVPLAMTIMLFVFTTVDMSHLPWFITPQIPASGCFLRGSVKLLYLYMPMLILIICNWMFYLMTAYNIWRLSQGTGMLDSSAGNLQAHSTNRRRFIVYLKLSVVMGLNWLLEIVSFLYPNFKMWYITDAYNILTGFAIFLIFVCKKNIYMKLRERYLNKNSKRSNPSPRRYSNSTSDSNSETAALQTKVSSIPRGFNRFTITSDKGLD